MSAIVDRLAVEQRERSLYAPYAMCAADSAGREHDEPEHFLRTAFQRDRDRIVHTAAFRRLQYKTQVFVNHEGDHFRTRLTHTTEVSQIARTIARALGCNEDLTEAIALAHDLGHPAFGHAGEDALGERMREHGGFEHNRQGLRIVTLLENPYPAWSGLNLTVEVRQSMLKHPRKTDAGDQSVVGEGQPLLEAQIVDEADSIAYVFHDLDDGLRAGILREEALGELELWSEEAAAVESGLSGSVRRRRILRRLIDRTVSDLVTHALERLEGIDSAGAARAAGRRLITLTPDLSRKKGELHRFLYANLYRHHQVEREATRGKRILGRLWDHYVENPSNLPPHWQSWIEEVGLERTVCDYVSGMTDRMAGKEYGRVFLPGE